MKIAVWIQSSIFDPATWWLCCEQHGDEEIGSHGAAQLAWVAHIEIRHPDELA